MNLLGSMDGFPIPTVLIVSTSPSTASRSRVMALHCERILKLSGFEVRFLDLGHNQPTIDYLLTQDDELARIRKAFQSASHVVFAIPVYQYDVASPAKRLIEMLSRQELGNRIVGVVCTAGSANSFMSLMPFVNSLMLAFRCWLVPSFVCGTPVDFVGGVPTGMLAGRLEELCMDLCSFRYVPLESGKPGLSAAGGALLRLARSPA
jgi:NAD(P)H-dependent FMN reductase